MGWGVPTNERRLLMQPVWHIRQLLPTTGAGYTPAQVTGGAR